jgi:hypothetical protein
MGSIALASLAGTGIRTPLHKQSECEDKTAGSGSQPKRLRLLQVVASYLMSGKHTSSPKSITGRREVHLLLSLLFHIFHRSIEALASTSELHVESRVIN